MFFRRLNLPLGFQIFLGGDGSIACQQVSKFIQRMEISSTWRNPAATWQPDLYNGYVATTASKCKSFHEHFWEKFTLCSLFTSRHAMRSSKTFQQSLQLFGNRSSTGPQLVITIMSTGCMELLLIAPMMRMSKPFTLWFLKADTRKCLVLLEGQNYRNSWLPGKP